MNDQDIIIESTPEAAQENVVPVKRPGFFKKGNTYGHGRPKRSKSQLENIRRRILMVVERRIFHEKDLDTVTTTDLLKFLAQIMPKDNSLKIDVPRVNYISNVPREEPVLIESNDDNGNGSESESPVLRGEMCPPVEGS